MLIGGYLLLARSEGGHLPRSARVRSLSERVDTLDTPTPSPCPSPCPSPSRTAVLKPCVPSPLTPEGGGGLKWGGVRGVE